MTDLEDKLVPATNDIVFKMLLNSEEAHQYLSGLISKLTGIPMKEVIKNLKIMNNERIPKKINDKVYRTDILVEIGNKFVNLEMNSKYYKGLIERNVMYQASIASQIQEKGDDYIDIPIIIQINFNKFSVFKSNEAISKSLFMNVKTYEIETESFSRVNIFLDKILEKWYSKVNLNEIEKQCLLLTIDSRKEAKKISGDDKIMDKVRRKLEAINDSKEFKIIFDYEKDAEFRWNAFMNHAKNTGIEEGIKKGIEEGVDKGFKKAAKDIAEKMLKENMQIHTISNLTGLSINEIKKLN